ncbi:ACT domain-containing protein [Uliginosibacterium sp. H3]|uniref:ACT domain-containing protein n=1 Tax=Uliginosibacterium silvisoli TaxID=3114758 RepID=A0ABU6K3S1_9RHOO|nr:ACT domain-containing protein [Uliginosibacterium sp. H3]
MNEDFVITAIGDDRPGLVEELAAVVVAHEASWLESSLAHVSGKFAGLVRIRVHAQNVVALQKALTDFKPLRVIVERAGHPSPDNLPQRALHLSLTGHDRVGIVREVSQVIARHAVNVESLNTYTSAAAMSGETMFHAEAELRADAQLDIRALQAALEALSNELIVDIALSAQD